MVSPTRTGSQGCPQKHVQGAAIRVGRCLGLAPGVLGMPTGLVRGSSIGALPEVCGQTSSEIPKLTQETLFLQCPLIFLSASHSFFYLPQSHRVHSSEVWVLLERNRSLQLNLYNWAARWSLTTSAFHILCQEQLPLMKTKALCLAVSPWGEEPTW